MHFQKQDLEIDHYSWEGNPLFSGEPTRRSFDRYNGHQVLFIINFYASLANQFSVEEGRKIERQIAQHLPIGLKSEISVLNWINTAQDGAN